MKKNLQKVIFSLSLVFLLLSVVNSVYAGELNPVVSTGLQTSARVGYTGNAMTNLDQAGIILSVPSVVGTFVGAALSLLGVAFMLLIIYGGFTWMFARGNDQAVVKAKGIIEAAVIGLVIVLAAYAITAFIGTSLTT